MAAFLYKTPGDEVIHGVSCQSKVFQDDEIEAALKAGWKQSPQETVKKKAK